MTIKPVADLYSITSPTGSETTFTFDAGEASGFAKGGWAVQEYVELERYQQAIAGNSLVTPDGWIPVSERMPLAPYENCLYEDVEVQVFAGEDVFIAHYAIGALPEPWGAWVDTAADITHWQPLAAAPQQEVK